MPPFMPYDRSILQALGVAGDTEYYRLSDADFARRHPQLRQAERLFEDQTLKDQSGDSSLLPAMQGEFMRAGLSGALDTLGDASAVDGAVSRGTLAPGSKGEAILGRSLGANIGAFQDRNRQNRLTSLTTAEQLFPRRTFGLSGADFANVEIANTAGQNNWNQADYATRFQTDEFNYLVDAQNRAADVLQHNQGVMANAQQSGAIWSGVFNSLGSLVGAAGSAAGGGAALCWVAREIFGDEEINGVPTWTLFREWMQRFASMSFLQSYAARGRQFASYLRSHPKAKAALRPLFEAHVSEMI